MTKLNQIRQKQACILN